LAEIPHQGLQPFDGLPVRRVFERIVKDLQGGERGVWDDALRGRRGGRGLTMNSLSVLVNPNEYGKVFIEFAATLKTSNCGKVPSSCGNLLRWLS
jgi:hypothetical protein